MATFASLGSLVVALSTQAASLAAPPGGPELEQALALVPRNAAAFVVVPSPKRASDEIQQCIERMERPEAALAGRPLDQLKAALGVSVEYDDNGPIAAAQIPSGDGLALIVFAPAKNGDAFLKGNFTPEPSAGPDAWKRGDEPVFYARVLDKHVMLSLDAKAVREFQPTEGIAATVRERLGERGNAVLARGDIIAWAGPVAFRSAEKEWAAREEAMNGSRPTGMPFAAQAEAMQQSMRELSSGLDDGLVTIDFDPLGVGVRTFAIARGDSTLGGLLKGGEASPSTFNRLPAAPFYAVGRLNVAGVGGIAALERLLAALPGGMSLPGWLTAAKDDVRALQFATYPSKLGVATGGLLNDAYLVIESEKPEVVRTAMREAILATAGEMGGVLREPTWVKDKPLKGGAVADAFDVKETVTPGAAVGYQQLVTQIVFGSRGLVGFVRPVSGAVLMTFSQRIDVLERGIAASTSGKTLADDATIRSYRPWLIENADVEGFLGVGQLGKLVQQIATMVGTTLEGRELIPAKTEPIGFAMDIDGGRVETALVMPASVLALVYDQAKRAALGGQAPNGAEPQ